MWQRATRGPEPPLRGRRSPSDSHPTKAIDALEAALEGGLDPEHDTPRTLRRPPHGELLLMPSEAARHIAVKVLTVGGDPRIQGVVIVFDARDARARRAARRDRRDQRAHRGGLGPGGAAPRRRGRRAAADLRPRPAVSGARRGDQRDPSDRARRHRRPRRRRRRARRAPRTSSAAARPRARRCSTARSSRTTPRSSRSAATTRTSARPTTPSRPARRSWSSRAPRRCGRRVTWSPRSSPVRSARARSSPSPSWSPASRSPDPASPRLFKSSGMSWEDAVIAGALA